MSAIEYGDGSVFDDAYSNHWKHDIQDIQDAVDRETEDRVLYAIAEQALAIDGEDNYSLEDELSWVSTMNVRAISKGTVLYSKLVEWYGDHDEMLNSVRCAHEDVRNLYYLSGNGYSTYDKDLLGGDGTDAMQRAFEEFLDTGEISKPVLDDMER